MGEEELEQFGRRNRKDEMVGAIGKEQQGDREQGGEVKINMKIPHGNLVFCKLISNMKTRFYILSSITRTWELCESDYSFTRDQRCLIFLDLGLQAVVRHPTCVLRTELGYCKSTAHT